MNSINIPNYSRNLINYKIQVKFFLNKRKNLRVNSGGFLFLGDASNDFCLKCDKIDIRKDIHIDTMMSYAPRAAAVK